MHAILSIIHVILSGSEGSGPREGKGASRLPIGSLRRDPSPSLALRAAARCTLDDIVALRLTGDGSGHQVFVEEARNCWIRDKAIGALDQPVALILEAQVLDGHFTRPQRAHNLLRFANGNARIVGTMYDEERSRNAIHRADRRDLLQELTIMLQTAVFRLA